ncbi:hypothetical protein LZ30DRAFT_453633 [Colletotrichum cereale]|nr:hypothetical protein LZ30DRAFT_453633 [Colletotrichum cereale]
MAAGFSFYGRSDQPGLVRGSPRLRFGGIPTRWGGLRNGFRFSEDQALEVDSGKRGREQRERWFCVFTPFRNGLPATRASWDGTDFTSLISKRARPFWFGQTPRFWMRFFALGAVMMDPRPTGAYGGGVRLSGFTSYGVRLRTYEFLSIGRRDALEVRE